MIEALGIRFARAERFAPPRLVDWDGSMGTGAFSDVSPQPPGEVFMASDLPSSEDCLSLNVWTPALDGKRPVMVWIHGGGFRQGAGAHTLSQGAVLADRGDVVVVTMNYRLGALGFLAHPDLGANAGLLDQLAALRWVRTNIAAFGGDPANVTLFGESAGSAAVGLLCASPLAPGLFDRAIMQSGAGSAIPMDRAADRAEKLATELGVSLAGLRDVPVDALLTGQLAVEASGVGMAFVPTIDGTVLDQRPLDALAAGASADLPLMIGTNVDEVKLIGFANPQRADLDEEGLRRRLAASFPTGLDEVIATYRDARAARGEPTAPSDLYYAIETDRFFRVPALRHADVHATHATTFAYLFGYRSPALGGWLGACHVLEIPFVFGLQGRDDLTWLTGRGPEADAMSARMMAAWVAFASTGDPSTPEHTWPAHDPATRPTMVFDVDTRVEHAPREPERAIVDAHLDH